MIGLIDVDSKIPKLAFMKISTYYKSLGEEVEFVAPGKEYDKAFASAIFIGEDIYRFKKLTEMKVDSFVMVRNENEKGDIRLKHFVRWVNSRTYKG